MPRIAQLILWGTVIVFVGYCYANIRYALGYDTRNTVTYSAPHVISEYADTDGNGFVPAQGDPLYDQHYAQEVNVPNSEALQVLAQIPVAVAEANYTQAEADKLKAETERIRQDTKMSIWGTRVVLVVVIGFVLFIVYIILKPHGV